MSDDHGKRYSRRRIEAFQQGFTILHTYAVQRATLGAYRTSLHRSRHSSSLRRRSPTSVTQFSLEHIYRILNSHGGGILGLHTRTAHGGQTEYCSASAKADEQFDDHHDTPSTDPARRRHRSAQLFSRRANSKAQGTNRKQTGILRVQP